MATGDLRNRAEAALRKRARARGERDRTPATAELVHELEVHGVELELQNQALRATGEELERSRRRFARLFERAPVAYLALDDDGRVVDANAAARALLGPVKGGLAGARLARFVPTHDAIAVHRHLRSAHRDEVAAPCHVDFVRPGKEPVPVRLESLTVESETGARETLTVVFDLSDTARIEHDAALRRARLAAVLDAAFDGIVAFDRDGTIESANRAGEQLLGLGEGEAVGRPLDAFLARATTAELVSLVAAPGGKVGPIRVGLRAGQEAPIPVELGVVEVPGEKNDARWNGRLFIAVIRDLRERERQETRLRQADKLEALIAAASGVAHDLVNLLMGIGGVVDTALRSGVSDDAEEALQQLDDAVDRGAVLAKRLLDFARSSPRAEQEIPVDAFVHGGRGLLRGLLDEHIELRLDLAAGDAAVLADKTELEQILLNLVRNAQDAMPRGGAITISTRTVDLSHAADRPSTVRPGRYVLLSVEDEGHGMDPETLAHAFEPFYTTKDPGRGTGVGLSSVREICRRLDGAVTADSRPGDGAIFRVYLPVVLAEAFPAIVADERLPGGHGRVLVIEDNDLVRETIAHYLHQLGYQPVTAANVDDAMREHDAWRDAVAAVTDVILRDALGREAAATVHAVAPGLPIVYISSYPAASLRERGLLERGDAFLIKPFNAHALGATLQRAMRGLELP